MCRLDTALHIFITVTDFSMVHFGPLYVALGLALILAVSYTYLALIYRQLYAERGPVHAALHLFFGLALLYNILLNYWLCVATPPGSTAAMKEVHITATTCTVLFVCKLSPMQQISQQAMKVQGELVMCHTGAA